MPVKNASFILGFQDALVTYEITDLFLSKGNLDPESLQLSDLVQKGLLHIGGWDRFVDSAPLGKGTPSRHNFPLVELMSRSQFMIGSQVEI